MNKNMFSVKFTNSAFNDLDLIYSYIKENLSAATSAERLISKIKTSILALKDFPFSCSYVEDDMLRDKGYRKLIIDNYIAFYTVDEDKSQVIIMRILYGAMQYRDLL